MKKLKNQKSSQQYDEHVKAFYKYLEIQKNKHHISWKNHNIEKYIKQSLQEYLKIQEKGK